MDDYSRVEEKMQKLLMKMTAINCILNQATRSINCIPIQQTTHVDAVSLTSTASKDSYSPGDTAVLTYKLVGSIDGCNSIDFRIQPENMSYISCTKANLTETTKNFNNQTEFITADPTIMNVTIANDDAVSLSNCDLVTVEFKISSDAPAGTYKILNKTPAGYYSYNDYDDETNFSSITNADIVVAASTTPISGATVSLDQNEYTYDGTAKTPTPTVTLDGSTLASENYEVSYQDSTGTTVASPAAAGTYNVVVKGLEDKGYTGVASAQFTIKPVSVEVPTVATCLIYSGSEQTGVASGDNYTVENGSATNAGDYTAIAKLNDTSNYVWSDNTTADQLVAWSIAQAASGITASGWTGAYNAKAHTITLKNVKAGSTTMYRTSTKVAWSKKKPTRTNAGKTTVYYKVMNSNYKTVTGSKVIKVNKAVCKYVSPTKSVKKSTAKRTFKITLKTTSNLAVKGQTVKIKINKKTYSAKTNSKGLAKFKVKLPKKTKSYKYKVTFKGSANFKAKSYSGKLKVK